jgi:hypothetical protein
MNCVVYDVCRLLMDVMVREYSLPLFQLEMISYSSD